MDAQYRYGTDGIFRRYHHGRPTTSEYLKNCNLTKEVKTALSKTFQELSHIMTSLSKDRTGSVSLNQQNAQMSLANCQNSLVRLNEAVDRLLKDSQSYVSELLEYVSSTEDFSEKRRWSK